MPICLDSKKARKNARKHAEAVAKLYKDQGTLHPMHGKTWAVTPEEIASTANWEWGNQDGSVRIAPAEGLQVQKPWQEKKSWAVVASEGTLISVGRELVVLEKESETKWVDTTPPKTEEELLKERVDKALVGWPWTSLSEKLVAVVSTKKNCPYSFVPRTD